MSAEQAGERCRPGMAGRRVGDGERGEHDRRGEHRSRCEHRPRDVADLQLPVDPSARVRERREHDGERARDGPPSPSGVERPRGRRHPGSRGPRPRCGAARRVSWGGIAQPRRNVKIGTVDCAIPATLESMCVSPHATSPIGTAALITPRTRHGRHAARSSATARDRAHAQREVGEEQHAASEDTDSVIAAGGMSSTATLMKRYEAPHIAASSRMQRPVGAHASRLPVVALSTPARSDAVDKLVL